MYNVPIERKQNAVSVIINGVLFHNRDMEDAFGTARSIDIY